MSVSSDISQYSALHPSERWAEVCILLERRQLLTLNVYMWMSCCIPLLFSFYFHRILFSYFHVVVFTFFFVDHLNYNLAAWTGDNSRLVWNFPSLYILIKIISPVSDYSQALKMYEEDQERFNSQDEAPRPPMWKGRYFWLTILRVLQLVCAEKSKTGLLLIWLRSLASWRPAWQASLFMCSWKTQ